MTAPLQTMEKALKQMGYATQVKALSDFYEDYGLSAGDEDDEPEDDEDEDEDDSEEDEDDMSEEEDAIMDDIDGESDLEME